MPLCETHWRTRLERKPIKPLEVVSKPQIRFKNPACQRDFASDSLKSKVLSKARDNLPRKLADHWSLLSPLNILSNRCEIPLY
jgi:hypothetical protein